jgi:hypothetical protein
MCHYSRFHILSLYFGNPILLMIYSRDIEHSRIRPLVSLARLRVPETLITQVSNWWSCSSVIVQHFCLVVIKPKLLLHCHFVSHFCKVKPLNADPSCRAVEGVGLRRLACWDCGFESRRGHGCVSVVNVVCC